VLLLDGAARLRRMGDQAGKLEIPGINTGPA
jgi:hypothetical protein